MLNENENIVAPKSREEHIRNFVKFLQESEDQITLFRDSIRDAKASYVENSWLEKEEIALAVKAYKALKANQNLEDICEYADLLKEVVR